MAGLRTWQGPSLSTFLWVATRRFGHSSPAARFPRRFRHSRCWRLGLATPPPSGPLLVFGSGEASLEGAWPRWAGCLPVRQSSREASEAFPSQQAAGSVAEGSTAEERSRSTLLHRVVLRRVVLIDSFLLVPKVTLGLAAPQTLRHHQNPAPCQDSNQSPRHGQGATSQPQTLCLCQVRIAARAHGLAAGAMSG